MFQFPGFPSYTYVFSIWYTVLHRVCFHIRKSADITLICSSPQLIAACHVLHRLLMPRHSPYALFCLNFLFGSHISELLEFQNMGFIFSHLKGFPFLCIVVSPLGELFPYRETVVFVTLNFRKDLDSFWLAIVVTFANLEISSFFLTICSFLYSFFIRFSKNKSSSTISIVLGRSGWTRTTDLALIRRAL